MIERPIVDVADSLNWNLLTARDLLATFEGDRLIAPIPIQSASTSSRLLLAGGKNEDAPSDWYLAYWLTVNISIVPDSQTELTALAELGSFAIPLRKFKLIWIPPMEPRPYFLLMQVPRWHQLMRMEIYWFDGEVDDETWQQLNRIELALP